MESAPATATYDLFEGPGLRCAALAWSGQEGPDWALRALHTGIARATRIWGMISHVLDAGLELDAVLDLDRWLADRDDAALMMAIAGNTKPSMLQELERTRATERHVVNGGVVQRASAHSIATPFNDRVVERVHEMEAGERSSAPAERTELLASVGP